MVEMKVGEQRSYLRIRMLTPEQEQAVGEYAHEAPMLSIVVARYGVEFFAVRTLIGNRPFIDNCVAATDAQTADTIARGMAAMYRYDFGDVTIRQMLGGRLL